MSAQLVGAMKNNIKSLPTKNTQPIAARKINIVPDKKLRSPYQNNTSINDQPNQSANTTNLFGSLVFDFSKDPAEIKIVDNTGAYELFISNQSLNEYKMEIFLREEDKPCKSNFAIFLGDCQCYPELPEGSVLMLNNANGENVNQQRVGGTSKTELPTEDALGLRKTENIIENFIEEKKRTESLCEVKNSKLSSVSSPTLRSSLQTPKDSPCEGQAGGDATVKTDEILVLTKKVKTISDKHTSNLLKYNLNQVKTNSTEDQENTSKVNLKSTKKDSASIYKSNLEEFIKFLKSDDAFNVLLGKLTPFDKSSKGNKVTVDGRYKVEYFEQENCQPIKEELNHSSHKNEVIRDVPDVSLKRVSSILMMNNKKVGEEIEELQGAVTDEEDSSFIQGIKKEFTEWQESCSNAINVALINDDKSIPSSADGTASNFSLLSDAQKTIKKACDEYEDATSQCGSDLIKNDSTCNFFLDLKTEEVTVCDSEKSAATERNSERSTLKESNMESYHTYPANYVTPIPFKLTSPKEIETMWTAFVRMFNFKPNNHSNAVQNTNLSDNPSTQEGKIHSDYPGQHNLPYFVEETLKEIRSAKRIVEQDSKLLNSTSHDSQPNPDLRKSNQLSLDYIPLSPQRIAFDTKYIKDYVDKRSLSQDDVRNPVSNDRRRMYFNSLIAPSLSPTSLRISNK